MLEQVRPAMFEKVRKIYEHSLSTKNEFGLDNKPLDSGEYLIELGEYCKEISNCILCGLDSDLEEFLKNFKEFVETVGIRFGHINSSWRTGTWGVRSGEIDELIAMFNFKLPEGITWPKYPDYNGYKFVMTNDSHTGTTVRVRQIRFNECQVIYELQVDMFKTDGSWSTCHSWNDSVSWSQLAYEPNAKPGFMTYPEYVKI